MFLGFAGICFSFTFIHSDDFLFHMVSVNLLTLLIIGDFLNYLDVSYRVAKRFGVPSASKGSWKRTVILSVALFVDLGSTEMMRLVFFYFNVLCTFQFSNFFNYLISNSRLFWRFLIYNNCCLVCIKLHPCLVTFLGFRWKIFPNHSLALSCLWEGFICKPESFVYQICSCCYNLLLWSD